MTFSPGFVALHTRPSMFGKLAVQAEVVVWRFERSMFHIGS